MEREEQYETMEYSKDLVWDFARWLDLNVQTYYEIVWSKINKVGKIRVYELTVDELKAVDDYEQGVVEWKIK